MLALEAGTAATTVARAQVEVDLVCRGGSAVEARIPNHRAARFELAVEWLVLGETLRVGSLDGLFKAMHGTQSELARVETLLGRRRDRSGMFGVVTRCLGAYDEVPGVAACATGGGV